MGVKGWGLGEEGRDPPPPPASQGTPVTVRVRGHAGG